MFAGETVTLDASASRDVSGGTTNLVFSWRKDNLFETPPVMVTLSGATTAMPTFTAPSLDATTRLRFILSATDSTFSDPVASFTTVLITIVAQTNTQRPTAVAGSDQTVDEGATVTLTGGGVDPESATLTYQWEQVGGPSVLLTNADMRVATVKAPLGVGSNLALTFSLTTNDGDIDSVSDEVVITVQADTNSTPNAPPVANAGPDASVFQGFQHFFNGGGSSDPEGQPLTYLWTKVSGPTTVPEAFLSETTARPTLFVLRGEFMVNTVHVFSLVVSDPVQSSAADMVSITVIAIADEPTVSVSLDQTVGEGANVTLTGIANSDLTGVLPTYAWTQTGGQTVSLRNADTDTITFTAPSGLTDNAMLTFTLTATDLSGNMGTDTGVITVTAGAAPPTDPPTDQSAAIAMANEVILPNVAQAISASVSGAIAQRIEVSASPTPSLNFGGQGSIATALQTHGEAMSDGNRDVKELLSGSDFVMPLNASGDGASGGSPLAFWGSGEYRDLSGEDSTLDWDGELSGIHLGFDARVHPDLLVGVAASWVQGDFDFDDSAATGALTKGEYEIDLASINPYIGWSVGVLDLWATAGYGEGDLEITPTGNGGGTKTSSDINSRSLSIGGSGRVLQIEATEVYLKGEVSSTELEIEGNATSTTPILAQDIDTTRVRLALEASQKRITAGGGLYEPSLEIGARYDGGDGENGVGLEVGGGVQYSNPVTRVTVEGRVRGLLGHSGEYEEWGISGSVRLQPGSDGQGLSFNITPGYGESQSGIQALFNATNKADTTADPRPYMDTRIGYGIPLPRWNAIATPYSELTIGTTDSYRLGINWKSGTRYTLTLSGERQERTTTPTHAVLLKGEVSF